MANSLGNGSQGSQQASPTNNGLINISSIANSSEAAAATTPSQDTNTAPVVPTTPGSTAPSTPVTPINPGSTTDSSAPVVPVNPGSNVPTNPDSGTPSTPGSNVPTNPDSGTPSTPGSNVPTNPDSGTPSTPGSNVPTNPDSGTPSDPGSNTPTTPDSLQPITQDTMVDTQATTGITTDSSQNDNRVPIAENITVANEDGSQANSVSLPGVGIPQQGDYVVTGQVKTTEGNTVTVNKSITVQENASLQDGDANTTPTKSATAEPVTSKAGETVKLFDSLTAKTADGQELSGLGNGGITFNNVGTFKLTYTIGDVQITKMVTVTN